MYDIIIGRSESDLKKFGTDGTVFLGKHYVKMGRTTSLSNKVYLDMLRSHVVFVCGKRGGGKSYTMGVIAEGMAQLPRNIRSNLSIILLDTMGIYWTMKYPNKKERDLLREWDMQPGACDIVIYTPAGYFEAAKASGIPTDRPFSIMASELTARDWIMAFELQSNDPIAVLTEKVIMDLRDAQKDFTLDDICARLRADPDAHQDIKAAAVNRFMTASKWGLFSAKGTPISDLAAPGQITVLDVSAYATQTGSWAIKSLVIGLVSEKLFIQRMRQRKTEEFKELHKSMNYFSDETPERAYPLVWLVIDEAHEFLPNQGHTAATDALVTILREGRQPGISLVLATQQPGKIHTDVMTQADVLLSHRLTARLDTDALASLMQSYMRTGLDQYLNDLPREAGAALILDDTNERIFPVRIRPRFSWHGGESPIALGQRPDLGVEPPATPR
ncbi:MAG: DUF87 domain-containing protein [Nanoarchaeota archaeon]